MVQLAVRPFPSSTFTMGPAEDGEGSEVELAEDGEGSEVELGAEAGRRRRGGREKSRTSVSSFFNEETNERINDVRSFLEMY